MNGVLGCSSGARVADDSVGNCRQRWCRCYRPHRPFRLVNLMQMMLLRFLRICRVVGNCRSIPGKQIHQKLHQQPRCSNRSNTWSRGSKAAAALQQHCSSTAAAGAGAAGEMLQHSFFENTAEQEYLVPCSCSRGHHVYGGRRSSWSQQSVNLSPRIDN